jgi:hypothetical protein
MRMHIRICRVQVDGVDRICSVQGPVVNMVSNFGFYENRKQLDRLRNFQLLNNIICHLLNHL